MSYHFATDRQIGQPQGCDGWVHASFKGQTAAEDVSWRDAHQNLEMSASLYLSLEPQQATSKELKRSFERSGTRQASTETTLESANAQRIFATRQNIPISTDRSSPKGNPVPQMSPAIPLLCATNLQTPSSPLGRVAEQSHPSTKQLLIISSRDLKHPQLTIGMDSNMPPIRDGKAFGDQSLRWKEVRRVRGIIWGLRSKIHEIRVDLKLKQDKKASADDRLFRFMVLQILGVGSHDFSSDTRIQENLEVLMRNCQEARDVYGPLEAECTSLENQLSRHEFKLTRLEEPFFLRDEEPGAFYSPEATVRANNSARNATVSSVDEDFSEPEYHPLVSEFLSKLADLDLLQERRDELMDEQQSLEEEKQSRLRLGKILDQEDQTWLDNSQTELGTLSHKVGLLEQSLEILKAKCLSKGLIDEDGEPTPFQALEKSLFNEEDGLVPIEQTSEYVKYPILFPHPWSRKGIVETYEPYPDQTSDITTNRINEWILSYLRKSALAVHLLEGIYGGIGGKVYPEWQIEVLKMWFKDSTISQGLSASSLTTETNTSPRAHSKNTEENDSFRQYLNSIRHYHRPDSESTAIGVS